MKSRYWKYSDSYKAGALFLTERRQRAYAQLGLSSNYVETIKTKLDEILNSVVKNDKKCNGKEKDKILTKLNNLSINIVNKIKSFTWTIATDSLNYQSHSIGCANCSSISEKRKTLKLNLSKELKKDFCEQEKSISLKQIDSVEEIDGENIDDFLKLVMCTERNSQKKNPNHLIHDKDLNNYKNYKNGSIKNYELEIGH